MARECVICNEVDSEESPLIELPCFRHWVCQEGCVASYFENATANESLYPPQCCKEPIPLERFDEFVPAEVKAAFLAKEQGEYTILPKYRVYCANTACSKFLHPNGHIHDADSNMTYAVCDSDDCFQATCCSCKMLLADGTESHVCEINDEDQLFKETVAKRGFKECFVCGATIELAEACNHITCECGNNFCYICGKEWAGEHGCPQYGPANYDEDGFNVRGYHRESGLNRDGRTFHEQMQIDRGEGAIGDSDEDDEQEGDDGEDGDEFGNDLWHQILSHVDPARRAMLESVDPDEREDALIQLQVELIDQGVVFNVQAPPAPQQQQVEGDGGDELGGNDDGEGSDDSEDDDGDEENDVLDQEVGIQEEDTQEERAQEGQIENAEVIQGIVPSMGGEEPMFDFDEDDGNLYTADIAPPNRQVNNDNPLLAGAWVDSEPPSPDNLSSGTTSTIESPVTSPEAFAELSDQGERGSRYDL
ncbi:uncharacterized protein CC84DRAFT_834351 [Paraphaeosphaeria sporulosa]|uniref:RBR-type E3 ubiquitin transferase n=1 Tax=Paraphaeosphaeria sporulosa TaxID=1460663 RepID=A0A177CCB0_9PLEO|nr:uncharacterized protein CC84DRAFT_834351 [Paraphaeosphaeria sporulosa]OAG05293.1 hypothetical protein CC84DRAFT_834351 [Paraphaeosphaeria sporulosa]